MERTVNNKGIVIYTGVTLSDGFNEQLFTESPYNNDDNYQVTFHSNLGSITVLDRMTGFEGGWRDVETGWRDIDGTFWLASGQFDIRNQNCITVGDAIELIKVNANTCIGYNE